CYPAQTCTFRVFCDIATASLVSSFDAADGGSGVDLSWASDAIGKVQGWNIYRASSPSGAWTRMNSSPIAMGAGGQFKLHDSGATSGQLYSRLAPLLAGGHEEIVSSAQLVVGGRPFAFAISGGNPFPARTTLRYSLPRAERVTINVFTVTGQRVRTLVNRMDTPGDHTVEFSLRDGGRSITPGV